MSKSIENIRPGWRARDLHDGGPDEFEELFELAAPGREFEPYSRSQFKRVR